MLLQSRTPSKVIFNNFFLKNNNIDIGLSFKEKYVAGIEDAKQNHFQQFFLPKTNINVGSTFEEKYVAGIEDAKQSHFQ